MSNVRNTQDLLKQKEITIPLHDLNPMIQLIISSIKRRRTHRGLSEASTTAFAASAIMDILEGNRAAASFTTFFVGAFAGLRQRDAMSVQTKHHEMTKEQTLIRPDVENRYPRDWLSISEIKKTHPILSVKGNGDVVLTKPSRAEYYRYLFQQSAVGKLGLNTWRWRVFLEPPKAPESVKKWARQKLARTIEQMKPRWRPVPRPAMVRVRTSKHETNKTKRALRRYR